MRVVVRELRAELMGLAGSTLLCARVLRARLSRALSWGLRRGCVPGLVPRVPCLGAPLRLVLRERRGYSACLPGLVLRERRGYSACPVLSSAASRSAASRAAFLARACASTSSGVRGPCVEPSLPSVRSHTTARLSRAPKRAR